MSNNGVGRRFEGKTAIVVGASAGIGAASARRLAAEGAKVLVADLTAEGVGATVQSIRDAGGVALAQAVDVSDESLVSGMIQRAVDEWGRLDVLHNNAADTRPEMAVRDRMVVDIEIDVFMHLLRVDLGGIMMACKHAIPHMLAGGGGAIVNTSSQAAAGAVATGSFAYGCAKAGVESLTRYVAAQYGKLGVRCNAVAPGWTITDSMRSKLDPDFFNTVLNAVPSRRLGQSEDQAATVAFLASDDAAFINGEVIHCGGGELSLLPTAALQAYAVQGASILGSKQG
ncbi:MAG: SDR family oxidoreductase [Caulobacteraceae bacterium]|nr:SDR family oxidoreductase [Caulobacteraceae bacterium]